ncbi:MAG TPA: HepT-like ribonuclease domain-containing protein [Flavisolibacter sp.]|jgi:uncharacterized protein with HEPN domain|nr:HepT-like ribonuclease domain-containing protein [Flavisolibacter sp.]
MPKDSIEYIKHIADECVFLLSVSNGLSREKFLHDEVLKRAVVRSLEIIGEAAKNISTKCKEKWQAIPWKNMAGMRDRLIHDYMGTNYTIV